MGNPTISKKTESSFTPTVRVKKLFQAIYHSQNTKEVSDDVAKIKVSTIISKMSFYYEKIRNSVDYKEEHLLRKNAIERILKRHIVIEGAIAIKGLDSLAISKHLITELIRAGYLLNNALPETKIDEIADVISKYLLLRHYSAGVVRNQSSEEKAGMQGWIISIAASDIEERLGKNQVDLAVIDYMYAILSENIKLPENSIYHDDRDVQIFIGIHRSLLKFDREMLSFILFKYYNPNWQTATNADVEQAAVDILSLKMEINSQIDHPLVGQLNRIISRYTVFFSILIDVISDGPEEIYEYFKKDPKAFPRKIKQICNNRYKEARAKLWRAAIRSIIYIFITKSIFVLILEIPAIKFFGEELNLAILAINISFPAVLLFLIVFFTRLPSEANTAKIVEGVEEIVFTEKQRHEPFKLRKGVKRGAVMNLTFGILYAVTFFISFGIIVWGLDKIGFTWVSMIIFLFFLAFVSFFSIRIRRNAKELIIVPPKENILSFFADFFYVPIIVVGKWLSEKFSRINVFVFILDFIIEAPFKIFVEIAEEWTNYVKERKEDVV